MAQGEIISIPIREVGIQGSDGKWLYCNHPRRDTNGACVYCGDSAPTSEEYSARLEAERAEFISRRIWRIPARKRRKK